jgi:ketosteroid isomerase-like protein
MVHRPYRPSGSEKMGYGVEDAGFVIDPYWTMIPGNPTSWLHKMERIGAMREWINIFIIGVLCIFLESCAVTKEQTQKDLKVMVDRLSGQAEKAFLSGDIETMLHYYCDDIISMPNDHPMIRGKADLQRMTEAILSTGMKFQSIESTSVEVQSDGKYVHEIGTFSQVVIMPGTTEPMKSVGKYLTIWKRQPNGELKIAVEIYNSDSHEDEK